MDPFPGSIGGDVGGTLQVNIPYDSKLACKVTLSCIYSYMSGSGKNRSRRESIKWQDEGFARVLPTVRGVDLQFRFEVPDNLPVSEEQNDSYHLWRLNVEADIPGVDLDRSFEIPVYATGEQSHHLNFKSSEEQPVGAAKLTAESLLPLSTTGHSRELYYPMLRKPARSFGLIIFGGIFGGVGLFLWGEAIKEGFMLYVMSSVFNLVGWGMVIGGIYSALNVLRINYDGQTITSKRTVLGFPIGNQTVVYGDILSVESKQGMSSRSGKKHGVEYSVFARLPGDKITLAEQLDSASKVDMVVAYFEKEFLQSHAESRFPKFEL